MTHLERIREIQISLGDCVVAWLRPEAVRSSKIIQDCERILCKEESVRYRRFLRPTDRHRFLVAHALKRLWLGAIVKIPAENLQFEANHLGKPFLVGDGRDRVSFNISHTKGLVVCAVANTETIGIDVEDFSRKIDVEVGKSVYSETEMNELRALPEHEQRNRFFQLWTLKEAYSKARGLGFQLPMKQCEFHFAAHQRIHPVFGPEVHDTPDGWRFDTRLIEPNHRCTLAIPVNQANSGRVDFYEFTEDDLRSQSD